MHSLAALFPRSRCHSLLITALCYCLLAKKEKLSRAELLTLADDEGMCYTALNSKG